MTHAEHTSDAQPGDLPPAADRCPWCDQAIPHEKFAEIHQRIEARERQRAAEIETKAKARLDQVRKEAAAAVERANKAVKVQADAARAEATKAAEARMATKLEALQKAKVTAEKQLSTERAGQERALNARLQEQRDALEKDKAKALRVEKAKSFKDSQRMEERLQQLQRQLQKKTADELGEGAEIDLFDELRNAFPMDEIRRVKRGEEGADIMHTITEKKRNCGSILYDSKNRTAWRNDFVSKLRRDQLAARADHAVLVCHKFPAGARQLHIKDGVILVNPARAITLVQLLRDHVVQVSGVRLSNEARAQKMTRLYDFITSEHCAQLLDQIDTLTDELLELEVKEKKAHDSTWKRRGELIRSAQQARGDLSAEIDQIIASPTVQLQKAK
jgi:hypothetical protein